MASLARTAGAVSRTQSTALYSGHSRTVLARHISFMRTPTPIANHIGLLRTPATPYRPTATALPSLTLTGPTAAPYSTLHQAAYAQSGRGRRWTPMAIALAMCPIITFGLGTWQVQRLRWKTDLIEMLEDRMALEAIPLPRKVNLDALEDFEYRKVRVTGRFRHDQEMLLGPRTRGDGQPGYFLITPLERTGGASKILVRRGWVPRDKKDPATRLEGLTEGEVTLEGLLRSGEQRSSSYFVPENKPDKNEWYSLDVKNMAELAGAQPVVVETILTTPDHMIKSELIDKNLPVGRSPIVEVRNHHKEYIFTWYTLCAATSVMLYMLVRRPPLPKKQPQMLPRHV
ncbi:surf-like protein [Actinomortierella ambigua]|nr:surf-like protein [Actinomortierella ambigua]